MSSTGSTIPGPRNRTCEDCRLPGPDLQCHSSDYLLCKPCRNKRDSAETPTEPNVLSQDTVVKVRAGNELNSTQHSTQIFAQDQPIINEILCFISNKINVLPYDVLVKLCVQSYDEIAIEEAKDILFETAFNDRAAPRKVKRRGSNKKCTDIQDILNIFLEFPSHHTPMNVAKDLSNLPPLSVDNFDIAKIIKDIEQLKANVAILQEAQGTVLESHVYHTNQLIRMKANMNDAGYTKTPATTEKPTSETSDESTTPQLVQSTGDSVSEDNGNSDSDPDETHPKESDNSHTSERDKGKQSHDPEEDNSDLLNLAEIQGIHNSQRWKKQKTTHSYVNKRRFNASKQQIDAPSTQKSTPSSAPRSDQVIKGIGRDFQLRSSIGSYSKSLAAKRVQVGIFVSRLAKNTQAIHIIRHVEKETGLKVQCDMLKAQHSKHQSACLRLPRKDHNTLLDPQIWPRGTVVRPYFD